MEERNEQLEVLEDIHEMLTDAIKLVANEPSVGLYFVQEHVHKAVPVLLNLKGQITEATADADLATADAKDSLSCISTMQDCGPPVIQRMIKMLQSASNYIPTIPQSRGSFSQLLPRPVRPPGLLGKGPTRSSSFYADWPANTSSSRGTLQRDHPLEDMNTNRKGPALPTPNHKRAAELFEKRKTCVDAQDDTRIVAGCDSSGIIKGEDDFSGGKAGFVHGKEVSGCEDPASSRALSREHSQEVRSSEPSRYVRALLGSAIAISREGVKVIRKDVESPLSGDGRATELKNWIRAQGMLGFGSRKVEDLPEKPVESGTSSDELLEMSHTFDEFRAQHAANLEAWLSEPDDAAVNKVL